MINGLSTRLLTIMSTSVSNRTTSKSDKTEGKQYITVPRYSGSLVAGFHA